MPHCETLVRSRWKPSVKDDCGNVRLGYWIKLRSPEPCGEEAIAYRIHQRAREQPKPKKGRPRPRFLGAFSLPAGTMFVTTCLCDKHKKKAEREGNEVLPVGNPAQTVENSGAIGL